MPAKELSPSQKADAARLKQAFKVWQAKRRADGRPVSQEEASDELNFGQSALSQYLNGNIPLNADALKKLCKLIGVTPGSISPSIVKQERERALAWLDADIPLLSKSNVRPIPDPAPTGNQLQRTAKQKRNRAAVRAHGDK